MKHQYGNRSLSNSKKKKKRKRKNVVLRVTLASLIIFLGAFFLGQFVVGEYHKVSYKVAGANVKKDKTKSNDKIEEKEKMEIDKKITSKVEEKIQEPIEKVDTNENKNNELNMSSIYTANGKKIAYLTFDDGPSATITPKILDILKGYNVKATFFVIGELAEQNSDLVKQEALEGHAIGNHTYSHNYSKVYSSSRNFIFEVDKANSALKKILGPQYNCKLFRFPGGSFETKKQPFKRCLADKEYKYIDWNALNGDAEAHNVPSEKLLERVKQTALGKEHIVILMHDAGTKKTTVQALPNIIEYLKAQGYEFRTLN